MSKRTHWILPLALLVVAGAGTPQTAQAASCLSGYMRCLNDTYDTRGWSRVMADLECGAGYVGCMRRLV